MRSIILERHRLCGAGVDLGTPSFDLGLPRNGCIGIRLTVEAPEKLQREPGSFLGWKPEDLAQHIGGRHPLTVADEVGPRECRL